MHLFGEQQRVCLQVSAPAQLDHFDLEEEEAAEEEDQHSSTPSRHGVN